MAFNIADKFTNVFFPMSDNRRMKRIATLFILLFTPLALALESTYFQGTEYERPKRELAYIVSEEGIYPENQFVYQGEKVRFFVTSTTKMPSCFVIKGKDFFLEAKKGKITEQEAYFERTGEYELYCPSFSKKSKITVLEHPRSKKDRIKRDLASKESKKIKIWRPKDE